MALYAFDGTNDDDRDTRIDAATTLELTNVFRFCEAYKGNAGGGGEYVPGVGTRFSVVGKALGGAFGLGWAPRVAETYDGLCDIYAGGDRVIDVIGFSRGAAMALDFVNKLAEHGIRHDDTLVDPNPSVRFVGLFDVVDAFGIANLGGLLAGIDPLHRLTLPPIVRRCFHAMALDERRPSFVNHRVDGAYEVWFRGVHSDVGGGNGNAGLNYVSLRWMYRKAMLCGLPITAANISDDAVHPEAAIRPNPFCAISTFWRTVQAQDLVHYTVAEHPVLPDEACRELTGANPIETPLLESTSVAGALLS